MSYEIAAYYFPNYHVDPRNEAAHGAGWTEWELTKRAEPRFPGHRQPRVPLWGYENEADPRVFAKKIDAAADHGVNRFIFDWYWYDDGPFLQRCLDEGYLGSPNTDRVHFALMWANHDWVDIHPAKYGGKPNLLYPGGVTAENFVTMTDHVIDRYFRHPAHWRIDGCPYFSIYDLNSFIRGLGGVAGARAALDDFRARTVAAGFPGLHLNAVVWGIRILPTEEAIREPNAVLAALGFTSVTSYVWVHHVPLRDFPVTSYDAVAEEGIAYWEKAEADFDLPYYPNVTMGWDSSPRTVQSDVFANVGYPFTPTLNDSTPERFAAALRRAKTFLDRRPPEQRILTLNAWNEWTEGSYLEPDTEHGLGYLEAIKAVFG